MKKLLIIAMIAACLFGTAAQAQTYNATGSERQAASADMGMYQLTLEAFRKSQYYLNPQTQQSRTVHDAIDVTSFGVGRQVLTLQNGQITTFKAGYSGNIVPITRWRRSGSQQYDESLIEDSERTLSEFNKTVTYQRIIYFSLSDIAEKSFLVIRNKKMNRQAAVKYLSHRIDSDLSGLIAENNIEMYNPRMTSTAHSSATSDAGSAITPKCGSVLCSPADGHGYTAMSNHNVVIGGFYEWSAIWDDGGVVLKSNYGQPDLSNRGRPWFSEAGIKGEKLSIAGSSDKGSSTSQKRGE